MCCQTADPTRTNIQSFTLAILSDSFHIATNIRTIHRSVDVLFVAPQRSRDRKLFCMYFFAIILIGAVKWRANTGFTINILAYLINSTVFLTCISIKIGSCLVAMIKKMSRGDEIKNTLKSELKFVHIIKKIGCCTLIIIKCFCI